MQPQISILLRVHHFQSLLHLLYHGHLTTNSNDLKTTAFRPPDARTDRFFFPSRLGRTSARVHPRSPASPFLRRFHGSRATGACPGAQTGSPQTYNSGHKINICSPGWLGYYGGRTTAACQGRFHAVDFNPVPRRITSHRICPSRPGLAGREGSVLNSWETRALRKRETNEL